MYHELQKRKKEKISRFNFRVVYIMSILQMLALSAANCKSPVTTRCDNDE